MNALTHLKSHWSEGDRLTKLCMIYLMVSVPWWIVTHFVHNRSFVLTTGIPVILFGIVVSVLTLRNLVQMCLLYVEGRLAVHRIMRDMNKLIDALPRAEHIKALEEFSDAARLELIELDLHLYDLGVDTERRTRMVEWARSEGCNDYQIDQLAQKMDQIVDTNIARYPRVQAVRDSMEEEES